MPKYEVDHPDDSDSDLSAPSLDNEFGVPIMQTPDIKKALKSATEKHRRSSRKKNPVTQFGYNKYMAHHYVFMMKAAAEQELESSTSLRHMLEGEEPTDVERPKKYESRTEVDKAKSQIGRRLILVRKWGYILDPPLPSIFNIGLTSLYLIVGIFVT